MYIRLGRRGPFQSLIQKGGTERHKFFFSRAYNDPNPPHGESPIANAERQLTIDAVICIFGHFGIVQEPP